MLQITERMFYEAEDFTECPDYTVKYSISTKHYINKLHELLDLPSVTINICY